MKLYTYIPIHINYYNYIVKNNINNSSYQFKSKYYNCNLQISFTAIDILFQTLFHRFDLKKIQINLKQFMK